MGALLVPLVSGCVDADAVLRMSGLSDEEIARRASRDISRNPEAHKLVSTAVSNGSATTSGPSPPLGADRPVAFEGAYYDVTVTETGEREGIVYEIAIDYDAGADGSAIDYEDLPAVDRNALDGLLPPPDYVPEGDGYDFGVGRVYADEEAEESVLVPDQEYEAVGYDGERYPLRADDGRTVTVSDYRYEVEEIATDATTFGAHIRTEYVFTLSGLSPDEREIIEEAIAEGYYETGTPDAFESIVDRFRSHPAVAADEWGGEWVVRFEGTIYWADLRHPASLVEA